MPEEKLQGQTPQLATKPADALAESTSAGPVDTETLRDWIANCDPYDPIDPEDERYFDFGELAEDLRGTDHIRVLFKGVTLNRDESCQLFSGFSGTGKSTELRRLKHLLEEAGYTVLLVDARDYHDLSHPLTIEDLMVILAGAFSDATARLLGENTPLESYWKRLLDFAQSDVEIGDVKVRAGVADLKIGLKHAKPFWVDIRQALTASPGKFRRDSHDFIRDCVDRIGRARRESRGVVFIFDSLERLRASMLDFDEMMQSAIQVLTESPEYLRLQAVT